MEVFSANSSAILRELFIWSSSIGICWLLAPVLISEWEVMDLEKDKEGVKYRHLVLSKGGIGHG